MTELSDSKRNGRQLVKLLRHDLRSRAKGVAHRAQILSLVDPSFEEQLSSMGLSQAIKFVLNTAEVENEQGFQLMGEAFGGLPRRSAGAPAPLKRFRRQLREEFATLVEEAQLLHQLDPSFQEEIRKLGLTEFVGKMQ